jgi:signal transduction histidine kinase
MAQPGAGGVVLVLRDMTEARRAESLSRELVANASHELRTPLGIIASTAETLVRANAVTEPRHREFLDTIVRHTARLERLVAATLQLSQIESGVPQGPWEELDVGELSAECVALYSATAEARGIRLTLGAPPEPTARVRGVESLLHQALGNLLDNAIRYTPTGGSVTVNMAVVAGTVTLSVADTGPGIPAELQARVFERFVRGPRAGSAAPEGLGLGLALVRRVAELHHGGVELDSVPGSGSRFTLRLPAAALSACPA